MSRKTQIASLWVMQVLVNAALLACLWWWLTWPDARAWQVAASFASAALLVLVALWLHGATLGYFAGADSLAPILRRAVRRVPALLVWLIVCVAILLLLSWVRGFLPQAAVRAAQVSGGGTRQVTGVGQWIFFAMQWVVVPVLMLPFAAEIASDGFRGWRPGALRRWRHGLYWGGCAVALAVGAYVPYKLVRWVPQVSSLRMEAWSMGLRFVVAYLLAITVWVFFAAILGRRPPAKPSAAAGGLI